MVSIILKKSLATIVVLLSFLPTIYFGYNTIISMIVTVLGINAMEDAFHNSPSGFIITFIGGENAILTDAITTIIFLFILSLVFAVITVIFAFIGILFPLLYIYSVPRGELEKKTCKTFEPDQDEQEERISKANKAADHPLASILSLDKKLYSRNNPEDNSILGYTVIGKNYYSQLDLEKKVLKLTSVVREWSMKKRVVNLEIPIRKLHNVRLVTIKSVDTNSMDIKIGFEVSEKIADYDNFTFWYEADITEDGRFPKLDEEYMRLYVIKMIIRLLQAEPRRTISFTLNRELVNKFRISDNNELEWVNQLGKVARTEPVGPLDKMNLTKISKLGIG